MLFRFPADLLSSGLSATPVSPPISGGRYRICAFGVIGPVYCGTVCFLGGIKPVLVVFSLFVRHFLTLPPFLQSFLRRPPATPSASLFRFLGACLRTLNPLPCPGLHGIFASLAALTWWDYIIFPKLLFLSCSGFKDF